MRTIAVLLAAVQGTLKEVAAGKDKPFTITAGELKQVTDAAKAKAMQFHADNPLREVHRVYSGSAEHGSGIRLILSARHLSGLLTLCQEAPKSVPPPPPPAPSPKPDTPE